MKKDVPSYLKTELNSSVIEFLKDKSSHGDLSEFFLKTVANFKKANSFTPSDRPYSYYLSYVNVTIFSFCQSMSHISFRLPEHLYTNAISDGGVPHKTLAGEGWFDFPVWRIKNLDHVKWANHAYLYALISD
jgi:hypothetical protein